MENKVRLNAEKIRGDIERMGLKYTQISLSMGKDKNYIAQLLARSETQTYMRETVAAVERALFQEPGAYCIEIADDEKPEEKPQGGGSPGGDIDKLRKDLNDVYVMQKAIYDELRSMHSEIKELLFSTMNNTSTKKEYAKRVHDDCYKLTQLWGGK